MTSRRRTADYQNSLWIIPRLFPIHCPVPPVYQKNVLNLTQVDKCCNLSSTNCPSDTSSSPLSLLILREGKWEGAKRQVAVDHEGEGRENRRTSSCPAKRKISVGDSSRAVAGFLAHSASLTTSVSWCLGSVCDRATSRTHKRTTSSCRYDRRTCSCGSPTWRSGPSWALLYALITRERCRSTKDRYTSSHVDRSIGNVVVRGSFAA